MKIVKLSLVFLLGILIFGSCSKEYKFKKGLTLFSAKIDGDLFVADSIAAYSLSANILPANGGGVFGQVIYAGGHNMSFPRFTIYLNTTDPGTYPVSNLSGIVANCTYYEVVDGDTLSYYGKSGTLTIEEFSGDIGGGIKGFFDFGGINDQMETVQVTDGSFEISFE